jgi:hypothetical protein
MQEGEDLLAHINMVKAFIDQLHSIEVKIEDENMYMVLLMSLPLAFDNLVTNLESMSFNDVGQLKRSITSHFLKSHFKCTPTTNPCHQIGVHIKNIKIGMHINMGFIFF